SRWGWNIGGVSLAAGQSYDMMLTYNASTYTFNQYINGVQTSSLQEAFSSTSLAGTQLFGIGGCPNEPWAPWGDASADETTSDFLLYNGALTASQVAAVDAAGASASLATISADVIPEPVSLGLMGLGGLILLRRRVR
ncbi:MAG: PEP-CTERM sorting domain-containing protein, partial [Tepidisphaeraceae bacterium]